MSTNKLSRREFLKTQLYTTAYIAAGSTLGLACRRTRGRDSGTRIIVLGLDGMDPILVGRLMRDAKDETRHLLHPLRVDLVRVITGSVVVVV